jgi:hypothetical protein
MPGGLCSPKAQGLRCNLGRTLCRRVAIFYRIWTAATEGFQPERFGHSVGELHVMCALGDCHTSWQVVSSTATRGDRLLEDPARVSAGKCEGCVGRGYCSTSGLARPRPGRAFGGWLHSEGGVGEQSLDFLKQQRQLDGFLNGVTRTLSQGLSAQ